MEAGKMIKLRVDRKSDIGYILSNGNKEEEVLLHFNDCENKEINIGEVLDVFLYYDHRSRVAATTFIPKVTVFDCGFAEVVDVVPFGVFVNIGIRKDILLSGDDLPLNKVFWPQVGDILYGYLLNDNDKALLFRVGSISDYLEIKVEAPKDVYGKYLWGRVIKLGSNGVNVFTEEGYLGFMHNSEYKVEPHLGEKIRARVINVKPNGELNLSLKAQKEIAIKEDYEVILNYLSTHLGKMPLSDNSTPEEIDKLLGISKKGFKRAMGKLLKENLITQDLENDITSLVTK